VLVDGVAHRADVHAGGLRAGEQGHGARWRPRGPIVVVEPVPAPRRAQMLAQELPRLRGEQADVQIIPLHLDPLADPAGRGPVVGGLDLDAAIEVHGTFAVPVVAKRFERERPEHGLLLGKHHRDLPFRRAVDARVGPAGFPAIQVRLCGLERLEAQALQRRLLRVADAGFDLPFAIGIADAAREGDHAIVREHIAIERIQRGVVDVRGEDAFFQIVEDDDADGAPQPAKGAFVEFGPDLGARSPHEQPHRFARVPQRQDEEPRASVLPRAPLADHRAAVPVVDLAFFAGRGRDDDARLDGRAAAQVHDEAPDTRVARRKAVIVDEVLPDGDGVAPTGQRLRDDLAIRLARTRARRAPRCGRGPHVGGHPRCGGRF